MIEPQMQARLGAAAPRAAVVPSGGALAAGAIGGRAGRMPAAEESR